MWLTIGSVCLQYPNWRFPGWHRLSVGLHLKKFKVYKVFFQDVKGQDCNINPGSSNMISPGDIIGFGYEFESGSVFFTYNGTKHPAVFPQVYDPQEKYDMYAAIGVEGANDFEVNFGTKEFCWNPGNNLAWKVGDSLGGIDEDHSSSCKEDILPRYEDI